MRYLLGISGPPEPLRPIDEETFQACLTLTRMQMHRHNEEYYREHPPKMKPLFYLYRCQATT